MSFTFYIQSPPGIIIEGKLPIQPDVVGNYQYQDSDRDPDVPLPPQDPSEDMEQRVLHNLIGEQISLQTGYHKLFRLKDTHNFEFYYDPKDFEDTPFYFDTLGLSADLKLPENSIERVAVMNSLIFFVKEIMLENATDFRSDIDTVISDKVAELLRNPDIIRVLIELSLDVVHSSVDLLETLNPQLPECEKLTLSDIPPGLTPFRRDFLKYINTNYLINRDERDRFLKIIIEYVPRYKNEDGSYNIKGLIYQVNKDFYKFDYLKDRIHLNRATTLFVINSGYCTPKEQNKKVRVQQESWEKRHKKIRSEY